MEYVRLSDDTLLEKCLHGKTPNRNEALNGIVPQRISNYKEVYVGREILKWVHMVLLHTSTLALLLF